MRNRGAVGGRPSFWKEQHALAFPFKRPDKSWREFGTPLAGLSMKMCLAAALRGVDWGWRSLPEHSAFPRRVRPGS